MKKKKGKDIQSKKFFSGEVELLNVDDIALALEVNSATIRRYIRENRLPATRIGKRYYVTKERFKEFLQGGEGSLFGRKRRLPHT